MSAADGAGVPVKFQQCLRSREPSRAGSALSGETDCTVFGDPASETRPAEVTLMLSGAGFLVMPPRLSAMDARKLAALLTAAADVADGVQS